MTTTTEPTGEGLTVSPPATVSVAPAGGRWIEDWRPEDPVFWEHTGERVARRNLWFSIFSEHIGFSVWSIWSVIVLFLGPKYGFTPAQKFLLTSTPTLVGSVLRIPYTFAVAKFGGRNWTVVSAALLIVPLLVGIAVLKPGVSFGTLVLVAAIAGVGGGNFASSMANINAFFPERKKGWALGLNAGGGNIGVAAVQLVGLAVLAAAGKSHPRYVLAIYVPLVVIAAVGAWLAMDNLAQAKNEQRAMRDVVRDAHTWVISLLYIGTFGSFIGFGFAFGQVLQVQFKADFDTPIKAAYLTFLGPLLGSLIRPVGGVLADRLGGSRVTLVNFFAMGVSAAVVLAASKQHSLPVFLIGFIALFVFSGVGNGSTYKMIPAIFRAKANAEMAAGSPRAAADTLFRRRSGALIGIAGAIGAFGGVLVNLAFRQSFLDTKTGDRAYIAFIAFYAVCFVVTWAVYVRPSSRKLAGV
ncbi:NNP family nitrate/nitrite transporter-like MFS transporter [Motilibacter rhizosphaerae]|uniref:NNP family nitrate/nitrite transporter-like MFS transporter n=1 Tax=Motilibacter rhizosphaerae TaxID=598652 RepID=A0A4Q7NAR1_9ACTN|nr:nitrate/nitrite transporter [Motilibacter rhizosphaerae]RZS80028.1 NNP family nitrate/nitrite transporter-like MFS transporter [Motilibacter rhizosphaerae]